MYIDNYVEKSLELHLFFGRIMKEHSLFLKAGFTPADASFSNRAEYFKNEFEKLLSHAISISKGVISQDVICSGELVTDFTAMAEKMTESFTGISINKDITARELRLGKSSRQCNMNTATQCQVRQLNQRALKLLNGLISFKELVLRNVLCCKMFTMNFPLLLEHIIREAKLYREYIQMLERDGCLNDSSMQEIECFWNQIMMEHALLIGSLLDPSETELINSADGFAKEYSDLLKTCRHTHDKTLTDAALAETIKFRDFKTAGTQGIEQCKIRSIILPLLADHVLREANHYIRLLKA